MYLDDLPALCARIHAFQQQTLNNELSWSLPRPVPASKGSDRSEYWFSYGNFEHVKKGAKKSNLAVFIKNPHRQLNYCDPHGSMLLQAPGLRVTDLLFLFHSHIQDETFVSVPAGKERRLAKVIKGVVSDLPWALEDANEFNFRLNKEIIKLYYMAHYCANCRVMRKIEAEFALLELSEYMH